MKTTDYFDATRHRRDRKCIKSRWILHAVQYPIAEYVQIDGRIRRWAKIDEAGGRYLRVVVLEDGKTVHNAFFDRGFRP